MRDRRGDSRIARLALDHETCLHVPVCVEALPQGGMAQKAAAVPAGRAICESPLLMWERTAENTVSPSKTVTFDSGTVDVVPYEHAESKG